MKREILFAISTFAVLFIVSFICSIVLGMGKAESLHEPASLWMYARRGLMIIFGLVIPWLRGKDNLTAFGWKAESKWIFITIGAGVLIGLGNKGGFDPASLIAIILALFHTFATELFFRRYLLKTFSDSFPVLAPYYDIFISCMVCFISPCGLPGDCRYAGKIIFVFMFTGLGIVFSFSYKKSGSFLVPWMMHFFGVLSYRLMLF